jgi:hypothetical protein
MITGSVIFMTAFYVKDARPATRSPSGRNREVLASHQQFARHELAESICLDSSFNLLPFPDEARGEKGETKEVTLTTSSNPCRKRSPS